MSLLREAMGKTQTAIQVLCTATGLGLLGILLFQDASWGANIFLWAIALCSGAAGLSHLFGLPIPKVARYTAPVILLFAACFGFREAPELKVANGCALFLLIGALLVRTKSGTLAQASVYELTVKLVGAWFKLTADFAELVVRDVKWTGSIRNRDRLKAGVRGVVIAMPLLLLFGGLFASADDAFRGILSRTFSFDWLNAPQMFQSVLIFLFCAIIAAGIYSVILAEQSAATTPVESNPETFHMTFGITEIAVIFGLLDGLFALFVIVQARYFFGGFHGIQTVEGISYRDYARHGFFELAFVGAASLATILGFHAMLRDPARHQKPFSILAGILTALVAVVMVSALQRMNLYIEYRGLTELRVYTTAVMIWLGIVLIWLAATVLRGHRQGFATGALAAGLAVILGLNVINPDATIAKFNLTYGGPGDVSYLQSLSLDAAPAVAQYSQHLPAKDAEALKSGALKRWSAAATADDWRSLNFSRWQFLSVYRARL